MFIYIKTETDSQKKLLDQYHHLASIYCYIDDYSAWLKEQAALEAFLQIARFFDIDNDHIQQELKRYRLQYECLRVIERLPIVIGTG